MNALDVRDHNELAQQSPDVNDVLQSFYNERVQVQSKSPKRLLNQLRAMSSLYHNFEDQDKYNEASDQFTLWEHQETLSGDEIQAIINNPDWKQRAEIAGQTNSPRLIRALVEGAEYCQIYEGTARNLSTPPDVFEVLKNKLDDSTHVELAQNPMTHKSAIQWLHSYKGQKPRVRKALKANISTSFTRLNALTRQISSISVDTLHSLAQINLPPLFLYKLAHEDEVQIRYAVTQNPNADEFTLRKLAIDPDKQVRLAVLKNPNIPTDAIWRLTQDEDKQIVNWANELFAIASNRLTPNLESQGFDAQLIQAISKNIHLAIQVVSNTFEESESNAALVLAMSDDVEVKRLLLSHPDPEVRRAASMNLDDTDDAPLETMREETDPIDNVKKATDTDPLNIADNKDASEEVLRLRTLENEILLDEANKASRDGTLIEEIRIREELSRREISLEEKVSNLYDLAICYQQSGDFLKAVELCEKLNELAEKKGIRNDYIASKVFRARHKVFILKEQLNVPENDQDIGKIRLYEDRLRNPEITEADRRICLQNLVDLDLKNGENQKALGYLELLLLLQRKIKEPKFKILITERKITEVKNEIFGSEVTVDSSEEVEQSGLSEDALFVSSVRATKAALTTSYLLAGARRAKELTDWEAVVDISRELIKRPNLSVKSMRYTMINMSIGYDILGDINMAIKTMEDLIVFQEAVGEDFSISEERLERLRDTKAIKEGKIQDIEFLTEVDFRNLDRSIGTLINRAVSAEKQGHYSQALVLFKKVLAYAREVASSIGLTLQSIERIEHKLKRRRARKSDARSQNMRNDLDKLDEEEFDNEVIELIRTSKRKEKEGNIRGALDEMNELLELQENYEEDTLMTRQRITKLESKL